MADFPAVLQLSSLNGVIGFRISGEAEYDAASVVASAGDVNGDGYDDLIIGAPIASPNGFRTGSVYVVFGKASGFTANLDLSTLDGANGFQMNGPANGRDTGLSVASAGDINGDGYDDVIISTDSRVAYVVFGKASGWAANLELSGLNGTNGLKIVDSYGGLRRSVASAGDVNGDGLDDLIVGTRDSAVVIFGKTSAFAATVDVVSPNGADFFKITGDARFESLGASVASAGDINGDGYDDVIVGNDQNASPRTGAAIVVFGKASGFGSEINTASLNGSNGFTITGAELGDEAGFSVASAGDVNGDGYADLIIGAYMANRNGLIAGAAYVVFGAASGFAPNINLTTIGGTTGFRIDGEVIRGSLGRTVASAGDINGDGYDDLVVSSVTGPPPNPSIGVTYVIYGKGTDFGSVVDVSTLDGTNGFKVTGVSAGDRSGGAIGAAGDFNGDGVDDLIIGASGADSHGNNSGASYVIFGRAPPPPPVNYVGTAGADTASGAGLNDTLSGLAGQDILYGMGGDDLIYGGDNSDTLYGGDGEDGLFGENGGDILYGGNAHDMLYGGEGADKLFGEADDDYLEGGDGNDRLDGGGGVDRLDGGTGNDWLDGGAGADVLIGGAGNDVLITDSLLDMTVEADGGGYDIVRTAVNGWILAANVEGLELQGSGNINGTGNGGANNLQGNSGANRLDGGAGVDTINGADGDDIIIGGLGNDLLRGGTGADTFVVAHAFGAVLETDQVYDFSAAEGDILDLSDAYVGTLALVSSFGKHAGEMTLTFADGLTTVRLDINGDGKADYQMKINGDVTGESGDWLL